MKLTPKSDLQLHASYDYAHTHALVTSRRPAIYKSYTDLAHAEAAEEKEEGESAALYWCEAPVQLRYLAVAPAPLLLTPSEGAGAAIESAQPDTEQRLESPRGNQLHAQLRSRSRPAPRERLGYAERESIRAHVPRSSPLKSPGRALAPQVHSVPLGPLRPKELQLQLHKSPATKTVTHRCTACTPQVDMDSGALSAGHKQHCKKELK